MRDRKEWIRRRSELIGAIILNHGPITAGAIRANLIEKHGTALACDLTGPGVARHIKAYMRTVVSSELRHGTLYYAIRGPRA